MKKKLIVLAMAAAAIAPCLTACRTNNVRSDASDWYTTYKRDANTEYNADSSFNQDLYYLNEFKFKIADPTVIYIAQDNEEKGYFYTYGTSDLVGGYGIQCWRSKDLTNWEYKSVAYHPDFDECWDFKNHWAPEVIYDDDLEGYLMFFNSDYGAKDVNNNNWATKGDSFKSMSVVFSKTPYGPFAPMRERDKLTPVYDFSADNGIIVAKNRLLARSNAIDAHPFIDPVTGDKYLYYSGYGNDANGQWHGQTLFGVKMNNKNWLDPDYSTVKELTNINKSQPGMTTDDCPEGDGVNEGAFVWCHDGKYYLTFSTYAFTNPLYQVRQAIADEPLGDFVKIKPEDGGTLLSTEVSWEGKIQSAGHHCFITCGDELMIAYHSFYNRLNIDEARAIAIDTVSWVKNDDGIDLMHTNGPTYSYQPLPEEISGYKNLAPLATVTATNTAESSDVKYLTDGVIKTHSNDLVNEYEAAEGKIDENDDDYDNIRLDITLKFDDYVNVRSIMVYNSIDYDRMFMGVNGITLNCKGKKRVIRNVTFDYKWHVSEDDAVIPGAACIAEFDELAVNEITLTFYYDPTMPININEIKVLGKRVSTSAGAGTLASYKYTPHDPVEAMPRYESKTFGTVTNFFMPDDAESVVAGADYNLYSNYGFDLSHDNDTDKYVDKYWAGNMCELYFKDVKASALYVEVELSVKDHLKTYNFDPAPKAGIVLRTKKRTFVSYNVDYQSTFDNPSVGYVESNATGSDYQWTGSSGYRSYNVPGISYQGEHTVKLGLARIGQDIYMFADGKFVQKETANRFDETEETAIGFVSFNCFTRYSNYSVITGRTEVVAKLAELGQAV